MDLYQLSFWLKDLTAPLVEIDGLLFLDRHDRGEAGIRELIAAYSSRKEAQSWINVVPLGDFLTDAVGSNWSLDDPSLDIIFAVYREVWLNASALKHPGRVMRVESWKDSDAGDVGLKLVQD